MSLPTLTDLKRHGNMLSAADDDELADHLDAAVRVVEKLIGRIDAPAPVTETHRNVSSDVLLLRRYPATSLVSVSSRVGATTTALTLADYELDTARGEARMASGGLFYGNYTVTYTTGREILDADYRLAVLVIAAHLWETQRGTSPSALALQDPNAGGDEFIPGQGHAIPSRALELLGLGSSIA